MLLSKVEKFEILIKLISSFVLSMLLLYISFGMITKYLDEPIVLETKYTFGDDDMGNISYPAITFCPEGLGHIWPSTNHCGHNSFEMVELFEKCLETKTPAEIFEEALQRWNGTKISVQIKTKNFDIDIPENTIYHSKYGYCKSFDVTRKLQFEDSFMPYVLVIVDGNPDRLPWMRFLIHSKYDLPDAEWIYPNMAFVTVGKYGEIIISKKVGHSIETRNQICSDYPFNTCKLLEFYKTIKNQFDCKSYFITESPFLDSDYATKSICNKTVQREIAKLKFAFTTKRCHQACEKVFYESGGQMTEKLPYAPHNGTRFSLSYSNPFVEVHSQRIAYTFHNLFGEIGGTLGITLGLSGFSIISIATELLKKHFAL